VRGWIAGPLVRRQRLKGLPIASLQAYPVLGSNYFTNQTR
jgi:hypothetical protein